MTERNNWKTNLIPSFDTMLGGDGGDGGDGGSGGGGDGGGGDGGAPESYTFAKIGEGDAAVDPPSDLVEAVTEFAKANGLSQEQAQAVFTREHGSRREVPETYTFNKVKNDKDEEVDVAKEVTDPISEFAKAQGYTQEQAQALLDRELELQKNADAEYQREATELQQKWQREAEQHEVLGKDGKFQENLAIAKKGMEKFFPELAKVAGDLSFMDHPSVILGMHRIGALIKEDDAEGGRAGTSGDDEWDPKAFFPTMSQKAN